MGRAYFMILIVSALLAMILPRSPASVPAPLTELRDAPDASASKADAPAEPVLTGGATTLEKGAGGHFFADAQVNGTSVMFLIDTGASGVALTTTDAQRIGLQFSPAEFSVIGRGASGPVRGKLISLRRVTLDGKTVENVDGAILEGSEISLLGQSFLNRMGSVEMRGDQMVLR
jgi:aspartyl protease family protein